MSPQLDKNCVNKEKSISYIGFSVKINKTDYHDITEILLKVALNTITS